MKIRISRRWGVFLISCLLFVLSQFYRASMAVISPDLIADLNLDSQGLSLISAAFFYGFAITQIPIGIYIDTLGPRVTMTLLTLVGVSGALFFGLGDNLSHLVIGRALLGIGMACNLMGALKLITLWFGPLRFATLSGIVLSVGTIGNLAATTPLVLMVGAMGWRMTFVAIAGFNLLAGLLFFLIVRDRPENVTPHFTVPAAASRGSAFAGAKALFAEKDYWIISLGTFCRYGIYAAVQALWAGPYLVTVIGLSPVAAGNLLFLMSVGFIIGSPAWGWFSDAVIGARKPVATGGLAGMALILAVLAQLTGGAHYFVLAMLFFGFGFFSSAGQIMLTQIKERMPIEQAGMAMTGVNFFTMIGGAVFLQGLGSMMEWIYPTDSLGGAAFRAGFLFCAGCLAVTALLYPVTRETLGRRSRFSPD